MTNPSRGFLKRFIGKLTSSKSKFAKSTSSSTSLNVSAGLRPEQIAGFATLDLSRPSRTRSSRSSSSGVMLEACAGESYGGEPCSSSGSSSD